MIATTIGGSTIGIRNTVRSARSSPERRFSRNANPTPITTCRPTVQNDSFACTQSELPNRSSDSSSR